MTTVIAYHAPLPSMVMQLSCDDGATRVDLPPKHRIYTEGERGERLYVVVAGKVKITRRSPNGRTNLLSVAGPSDMFGALSIFDAGPRSASATTLTDVCAFSMDQNTISACISDRPEVADQLLRALARRLRHANDNQADLLFNDVAGRVAKMLLQQAFRFGTWHGSRLRVTHDLTQDELAQLVGASRETVNKALSDFTQRGWILLDGRSVLILDPERLSRRAV